ncbi:glycosyltransferase family 4 protein [Streptomyces rhizosphaericus]|uniref:D-inositol 3-phosphate glycosyltransferase n=1 Tax=Streptomyces rhizosphaericus TaxID=114699 RepID=A0A6G4AGQ4_9ACTN|nr:glycosyltransferase family 4 protein [Streptomyces rhizosphaericus]NEW71879.1 glycosyltransferase family 4 protein [Streptomyces rhizosphaericus]
MKIAFLLHNAYGIGGTIRTTMNLATALADRHEVEIVSMMRHRETPRFALDPRVRLVPLVDTRPESADAKHPLFFEASRDFPAAEKRIKQYNRLMDTRAAEYLRGCDAEVIVGTRPGVNVYISRFAPRRALRIAQEHLRYEAHSKKLRAELAPFYRTLDAVVTTTEADAAVYRRKMPMPGVRTLAIPNSVPDPGIAPSEGTEPVIAAAGRLVRGKRFDLLIDAFAEISAKFPAWRLRIYGGGAEKERLAERIERLGLSGSAELMGSRSPIEAEFAKASLVAVASDAESFGMTIVEAMRCGVPVVSTDCPLGPAEIIKDGVTGRLVPTGDKHALASALMELMGDSPARRAMGAAALESSRIYDPEPIARRYDQLFEELRASRFARLWERYRTAARARLRRLARRFGLSPGRRTPAAGRKASA